MPINLLNIITNHHQSTFLLFFTLFQFAFACLSDANNCCINNCQICNNYKQCQKCISNYILSKNNICYKCQCYVQNCSQCNCDNSAICILCNQSFELSKNSTACIKNSNQTNYSTLTIITIILAIFGSLGIIVSAIIFFRRLKNRIVTLDYENNQQIPVMFPNQQSLVNIRQSQVNRYKSSNRQNENFQYEYKELGYNKQRDSCSICLQNQCDIVSKCNHYFHLYCLRKWVERNKNCPLCKSKDIFIINYVCCLKCRNQGVVISIWQTKPNIKCNVDHNNELLAKRNNYIKK